MSDAYTVGMVAGILFACIVYLLVKKQHFSQRPKYDERQKLLQKTGYMWGFYTAIILILCKGIFENQIPFKKMSELEMDYIIVLISLTVYLVYCIFHDAYVSLTDNPLKTTLILCFLGAINLGMFLFVSRVQNKMNLYVGLFSIFIALILVIRQWIVHRRE